MHTLRLFLVLLKINLQQELAYRADLLINILINLMWLGWELLGLSIIFNNTSTLSGWKPGELVILLGVFHLVNMLMAALLWPNTEKFNTGVREGTLDYTLLQPADSLFMVSFARIVVWRVWDLLLGAALILVGLHMSGDIITPIGLVYFLLLMISGAVILYSLWIVLIAATFWFVKFDNNVTILQALLDAGRFPATVYPPWLRLIITFVVPIAVATTVPLQGLRGDLHLTQVFIFLAVGAASLLIALRVWRAGVRQYSGASS